MNEEDTQKILDHLNTIKEGTDQQSAVIEELLTILGNFGRGLEVVCKILQTDTDMLEREAQIFAVTVALNDLLSKAQDDLEAINLSFEWR